LADSDAVEDGRHVRRTIRISLEVLAKTGAGFKGLLKSAIRDNNPVFF